jgi:hypothetical protein
MKGRREKIGLFQGGVLAGGGCAQGKEEWGCIWWMYFVSIYENRRMKTCWNCSKRGGSRERTMEGVNLSKIYCKHICKYHNVQLLYVNKNFNIKKQN